MIPIAQPYYLNNTGFVIVKYREPINIMLLGVISHYYP